MTFSIGDLVHVARDGGTAAFGIVVRVEPSASGPADYAVCTLVPDDGKLTTLAQSLHWCIHDDLELVARAGYDRKQLAALAEQVPALRSPRRAKGRADRRR